MITPYHATIRSSESWRGATLIGNSTVGKLEILYKPTRVHVIFRIPDRDTHSDTDKHTRVLTYINESANLIFTQAKNIR